MIRTATSVKTIAIIRHAGIQIKGTCTRIATSGRFFIFLAFRYTWRVSIDFRRHIFFVYVLTITVEQKIIIIQYLLAIYFFLSK